MWRSWQTSPAVRFLTSSSVHTCSLAVGTHFFHALLSVCPPLTFFFWLISFSFLECCGKKILSVVVSSYAIPRSPSVPGAFALCASLKLFCVGYPCRTWCNCRYAYCRTGVALYQIYLKRKTEYDSLFHTFLFHAPPSSFTPPCRNAHTRVQT